MVGPLSVSSPLDPATAAAIASAATRAEPDAEGGPDVWDPDPHARAHRQAGYPISPAQGQLLYLLARAAGARRIVEFATALGISTMYLAAAVRDNGGGVVIGSEIVAGKADTARANLATAGLDR